MDTGKDLREQEQLEADRFKNKANPIEFLFRQFDKKGQADIKYAEILKDFPDLKATIKYLLRYKPQKYAIFVSWENSLEWEADESVDLEDVKKILSKMEGLVNQPCVRYFGQSSKKELYVLIGSTLAYALENNYAIAETCMERVEEYIDARKYEVTREWQLLFCIGLLAVSGITFLFMNKNATSICSFFALNVGEFRKGLYCFWGVVGATFSIIQSTGKTFYDCQSGKMLNFLQVFSKILTSIISSIFVIYLFEMGLIFNNFKGANTNACLVILCIIAGFSERLVPSIIDKFCEEETKGSMDK